jgi:hypothetical protein
MNRYSLPTAERLEAQDQTAEIRKLKAELRRVTEERDILKKPPHPQRGFPAGHTLPRNPGKVRIHPRP